MPSFVWFLITLAAATAGGLLLYKLNFPAGAMVGALVCVGLLNILTGQATMPSSVKFLTRMVAGLFVGMNMNMDMVRNMKRLLKPVVLLVVIIQSLCLGVGILLYRTHLLDVVTSLFCVAPGGMTDMTLMTMDMGGDAAVVAVLQVMRLLTVYCISMPLVRVIGKKGTVPSPTAKNEKKQLSPKGKRTGILLAAITAAIGGGIGFGLSTLLDFSVLVLIGAMVASAAVNIKTGRLYMPKSVRRGVQILSGALIGTSVTYASLLTLRSLVIPALFICTGFVVINLILAVLLHKFCGLNLATAMLSSSAGGATEASLTAPDLGADPSVVSVLQITRMVCTTSFYPILVQAVYKLL